MNPDTIHSLMTRRRMLMSGAKGILAVTAFPSIAAAINATPPETEGPFWVDEHLNRVDVRSSTTTGVVKAGFPLQLGINVSKIVNNAAQPLVGAYVDIWHCDANGLYSDVNSRMQSEVTTGQNFLRGYQLTNAHGGVRFLTIYPGWYPGRTTHIHVRIRKIENNTTTFNFTTQFFFSDTFTSQVYAANAPYNQRATIQKDTPNTSDNVYKTSFTDTDGTVMNPVGAVLFVRASKTGSHAIASYNIKVRTT